MKKIKKKIELVIKSIQFELLLFFLKKNQIIII